MLNTDSSGISAYEIVVANPAGRDEAITTILLNYPAPDLSLASRHEIPIFRGFVRSP